MTIRFPHIVLFFAILLGGIIYALHLQGLVTAANEVYARFLALGVFVASFLLIAWQKAKNHRFSWGDFYKNETSIIVSLTLLLVTSFLAREMGYYAVTFFVVAALVHFLYTHKFYPPPKVFYFVFLYALLMFLGTIGTPKGFGFPDRTLSFYVLPLSLCFFRLSKETLLKIGEVFFKMTIVFLTVCVLYWWYNFLHLDADFLPWISGKTGYITEMPRSIMGSQSGESVSNPVHLPAYFFISLWSYYNHPSFIAFVLLCGLIVGFYLYSQKCIATLELALCIALCFFVVFLLQSRVGIVSVSLITAISILYFLFKKSRRLALLVGLFLIVIGAFFYSHRDKVEFIFIGDPIRTSYSQIAVSYIKENFWWGSGYNNQQQVLEQQAEKMIETLAYPVYPPIYFVHNQFLDDMVQYGIWGLIALLLVLGAIACYAIKNRSYLLLMLLCSTVILMWIDAPFYKQIGIMRCITFLVFFVAIVESTKDKSKIVNIES
ncbi:MAG: O-antigen ligase family protein [Bacteroidales bacterium]|nr:O-antigen ligase family protein [Bacteroidales bacterium]